MRRPQRAYPAATVVEFLTAVLPAAGALPEEVAIEARRFFEEGLEALTRSGMPWGKAAQVLATLEGAMLLANVLARPSAFDAATADLS